MRRLAATLALVALLAASGCAGSGDSGPGVSTGLPPAGGGGTLAYALPALPAAPDPPAARARAAPTPARPTPPATLDPLAARTRADQTVTRQIHEPLIERLSGPYRRAAPQPGLALEVRPSRDRTTWTVTLRPNVRFQDGTPFNAAAVLA